MPQNWSEKRHKPSQDINRDQMLLLTISFQQNEQTRNKCLTSSNKKLLGAPGIATRSKDATNGAPGIVSVLQFKEHRLHSQASNMNLFGALAHLGADMARSRLHLQLLVASCCW